MLEETLGRLAKSRNPRYRNTPCPTPEPEHHRPTATFRRATSRKP